MFLHILNLLELLLNLLESEMLDLFELSDEVPELHLNNKRVLMNLEAKGLERDLFFPLSLCICEAFFTPHANSSHDLLQPRELCHVLLIKLCISDLVLQEQSVLELHFQLDPVEYSVVLFDQMPKLGVVHFD